MNEIGARRLRLLRDGYGPVVPEVLLDAMTARRRGIADLESANAADSRLDPGRRRHAAVAAEWALGDRRLLDGHRAAFLEALRL
ncbi:hypothetical protein [Actinoplanes sp. NPDC048796]|uniref:hypothetical protein n=1 Tax=Actinoplanes sp. NPDC048796 TaxID=3155640 RepID=UPI0033BFF910